MSVCKITLMLLFCWGLATAESATEPPAYTTPVYASEVDPNRLQAFHATWIQKNPGEDQLSPITIEEQLSRNAAGDWLHQQTMHHADNPLKAHHQRTFDQHSMRLLKQSTRYQDAPPQAPKSVTYHMQHNHFIGEITTADGQTQTIKQPLSMPMFDGQIAGLAIAALPLAVGKKWSMPMTIPTMKAEFWLQAKVTAKQTMAAHNGQELEVWVVDALWHNLTDGDVYPAGPNNSGGTYYITVQPQAGQPVVMAYANNNALILWDGEGQDSSAQ